MFTVTNLTSNAIGVGNVYLEPGQARTYPSVDQSVVAAMTAGSVSISPDPTVTANNLANLNAMAEINSKNP